MYRLGNLFKLKIGGGEIFQVAEKYIHHTPELGDVCINYEAVFSVLLDIFSLSTEFSKAQKAFAKDLKEFEFECIGDQLTDEEKLICKCSIVLLSCSG